MSQPGAMGGSMTAGTDTAVRRSMHRRNPRPGRLTCADRPGTRPRFNAFAARFA